MFSYGLMPVDGPVSANQQRLTSAQRGHNE